MANNQFDKKVQERGYCCPLAFIRINILPTDTVTKLAEKAGVCVRTIRNQRRKLREGNNKCQYRSTCLRACWMLPNQMMKDDKEREKDAK